MTAPSVYPKPVGWICVRPSADWLVQYTVDNLAEFFREIILSKLVTFQSPSIGWHRSRSHNAVIRVYDDAGNVIQTHEHTDEFKAW